MILDVIPHGVYSAVTVEFLKEILVEMTYSWTS